MPVPHEHGAWIVLYAPLVVAAAVARPFRPVPELLLLLAVTAAFLARNVAGLLLRGRGKDGSAGWLAVFTALFAAGALPLLLVYRLFSLLQVGAAVVAFFVAHAALTVWPARKRLDRSQWGELLGVGALSMTGPAAWMVATGGSRPLIWGMWAACVLFFGSSVFHVKMLLAAVKVKGGITWADRLRLGRDLLAYHVLLAAAVLAAAVWLGGVTGALVLAAYLPILARAFAAWATLSNKLPPLKRVGVLETCYSLWFAGVMIGVLRG